MNTTLYYNKPAEPWTEALPIGNGRLGAMIYGGTAHEQLQLNEETLWSGWENELADNPECAAKMDEMRALLFAGKISEAEKVAAEYLVCTKQEGSHCHEGHPWAYGSYQTAGNLFLDLVNTGEVSGYARRLDLRTGLAVTEFSMGGQRFTREVFASIPNNVMALKLTSDGKYSCRFTYERKDTVQTFDGNCLKVHGGIDGEKGLDFALAVRFVTDGRLSAADGGVLVEDAGECVVIVNIVTTYKKNIDVDAAALAAVSGLSYERLRKASLDEFAALSDRVSWDIGGIDSGLPINERLKMLRDGTISDADLTALVETYWMYGRYLSISSSYKSVLPANLQGIWCEDYHAIWSADYHININIQMNYWLTETLNLPECADVFLRYIKMLAEAGKATAKIQYNCGGWVAHTITNPWGFTSPGDAVSWGSFMCAGAWCCAHIWERWLFGGDVEFLREYYPVLRSACEFFLDFLCEDPKTGHLVTAPSNSPENHYRDPVTGQTVAICAGPTMDNSILYELFTNTAEAAAILGIDSEFAAEIIRTRDRLPPLKIGKYGQIMEWQEDFEETEVGHRHLSMLYALHPSSQITKTKTPALFDAAKISIARRLSAGGGHTGWSRAWIINFYARLGMGDDCLHHIRALLEKSTYDNLFDSHPPFQIDGNFGGTAGMAEMLIQSHDGFIELLPALPDAWKTGSFKGFCARGGFVVDAAWENGAVTAFTIASRHGAACEVRTGGKVYPLTIAKGERITVLVK